MDIELLRTFIEVKRTGHFGKAADNLFLTQSAVSARIRQLEETLGTTLFTRQRNDIRLTSAGERLLRHAETIVNAWQRARLDTNLEQSYTTSLSVGALFDLWDGLLLEWLSRMREDMPDIAWHFFTQSADTLYRQLLNGVLDLIFLFETPVSSELDSKFVRRMPLMLVGSNPGLSAEQAVADNFIMVDWGTAHAIHHARLYPDAPSPSVHVSHGGMALSLLLREGGCAYLPREWLTEHLASGVLHPVMDAPLLERDIHAVWRLDSERVPVIQQVMKYL